MEFLNDEFGFRYLESLPENAREATLDDFHVQGKLIKGMQFLILGYHWPVYQLYEVTERLKAILLLPFIENHRVFVFKAEIVSQEALFVEENNHTFSNNSVDPNQ